MNVRDFTLNYFMRESLRIEGIHRKPTTHEIDATETFIALPRLTVNDVVLLVAIYQPGARLRNVSGLNVRVGDHFPPPGGPSIESDLMSLLRGISERKIPSWEGHILYERLHPFTDGNGRSGRAIWLWQANGHAPLGFLHHFYYQTLSNVRATNSPTREGTE